MPTEPCVACGGDPSDHPLAAVFLAAMLEPLPPVDGRPVAYSVPCPACGGERWVCEDHPDRAWEEGSGCCGGAGMPCLVCNQTEPGQCPAYPPGSVELWSTVPPSRVRD